MGAAAAAAAAVVQLLVVQRGISLGWGHLVAAVDGEEEAGGCCLVVGGDGCWHRQARLRLCGKGVDAKLCVIEFVRVYVCMYVCVCVCVCVCYACVFAQALCV